MSNTAPHALYRFYDTDERLLYVGITLDPGSRWNTHRKTKPWWHDVAQVTVEIHPSRQAVLDAERDAILAEKPRHNVVHNHSHAPGPPTRCRCDNCRMDLPHDWGTRAEDMPDDCHDVCVKQGICGIYFPFKWRDGRAHYICQHGHYWTCGWGHNRSGDAREWARKPYQSASIDNAATVLP